MKLPEHVFITPNKGDESMGAGFVLLTRHPYYLGRIIKVLPTPFFAVEYKNQFKPLITAEIDGYSILISFAGNLSGYRVEVSGPDWEQELQKIYNKMATYFYKEKILNNLGYYRRYKL